MPQYPIAPWLTPADPAGQYSRGFGLGQQGAEASARLAIAQMQMSAEQQRYQQDFVYRQQQMEMNRAMEEQRMSLEKQQFEARQQAAAQELAMRQQELQLRTKQAAEKSAAMQGFQRDMQEELSTGGDGTKSILKWGAVLGGQGTPEAAILRARLQKRAEVPDSVKGQPVIGPDGKPIPGVFATTDAQGLPKIHNIPGYGQEENRRSLIASREFNERLRQAQLLSKEMQQKYGLRAAQFSAVDPSKIPENLKGMYKSWRSDQDELDAIMKDLKGLRGQPGAEPISQAAPEGQKYIRWKKDASGKPVPEAGGPGITPPTPSGATAPGLGMPQSMVPPAMARPQLALPQGAAPPNAGLPAPAAAPAAPETPDYIRAIRDELKRGGTNLSKGAKDYLGDLISGMPDEALAAAAQKHGISDVVFKDGEFFRPRTRTEMKEAESQRKPFPFDDSATQPMGRLDLEDELYAAAQSSGWQSPWE